jgi:hypothetical protein
MDGGVMYAAVALAIGQIAAVAIVIVNGINARLALAVATAAAAEMAVRERQWALEDRHELASSLARKVESTADELAIKVQTDHLALMKKVDTAEASANSAVETLTDLVKENTKISTDAFHEANGAKLLLAEEVKRRNDIETARDGRMH